MVADKRILFYVPETSLATNGVYASQVGGLVKYLESLGAETLVWDGVALGHMWFYQVADRMRQAARKNAALMAFKPTHIYVRTYPSCLAAKELAEQAGAKLVYSIRGADVAEALLGRNMRAFTIAAYAAWGVRQAVRLADHVGSVSRTMANWIKGKWGREASVLPCCVADGAFAPLTAHDDAEKTVVYCGGLSSWQKIDEIIAVMKRMGDADTSIKFRFLTKDADLLAKKCAAAGLSADRWTYKPCKPSEVPGELAKADCGIIIRDNNLVNQVASPIKVGEYLAAGLGVIASPYIGDVASDLSGKCFAKMLTPNTSAEELVAFVRGLNDETRKAAQDWTRAHLTYEGNRETVIQMFS